MSSTLGFEGAPATGAILAASLASSLVGQNSGYNPLHIRGGATCLKEALAFRLTEDLALGSLILYHSRVFERQKGTRRHAAVISTVLALDQLVHLALRVGLASKSQPGPYSLIAFTFAGFCLDIPATSQSKLLGLQVSNKILLYAAHAYLAASAARHSAISIALGAAIGFAYHSNLLGMRRLKVPAFIARICSSIFGRIVPGSQESTRAFVGSPQQRAQHRQGSQQVRPVEVSAELLAHLLDMGFDEERSRAALAQTGNDVQRAIAQLV